MPTSTFIENREGFVIFYSAIFSNQNKPLIRPATTPVYWKVKNTFEQLADAGRFEKYGIEPGTKCFCRRIADSNFTSLDDPRVRKKLKKLQKEFDALDLIEEKQTRFYPNNSKPVFNMTEEKFYQNLLERNYPDIANEIHKEWLKFKNSQN